MAFVIAGCWPGLAGGQAVSPDWGRLANPGFEGQSVRATFFFAGQARDTRRFYEYPCTPNVNAYTIRPIDGRLLRWSESAENRAAALAMLEEAGVNVINMSFWGARGTDYWSKYAPMQTSTYAHDELFTAAADRPLLIAPWIESHVEWTFRGEFPGEADNPSPGLVLQIRDLVTRYLLEPADPRWPAKWARVTDREGQARYLVGVIHVASDQPALSDGRFAAGFDAVAAKVEAETGVRVGFALDLFPPDSFAPGAYKAAPATTGVHLFFRPSVLAVECYIPEIWIGSSDEARLLAWKRRFLSGWIASGIPVILDVSPGYDAHIVFPGSPLYGNNTFWRVGQGELVMDLTGVGITYNAWNGYTEGYAGVPTREYGDAAWLWAKQIFALYGASAGTAASWRLH